MTDFLELCKRIRQHCQTRQWFGSDAEEDWRPGRTVMLDMYDDDSEILEPEELTQGFARPTATTEQIDQAKARLGAALPPALEYVYRLVTNGAFGPGYGLFRVERLHLEPSGGWRLSERAARYLESHPRRFLECDDLPAGVTCICDWGCGIGSLVDLHTGRVYGAGAGRRSDWNGVDPDASEFVVLIDLQASSVEDWFERWLRGVLDQPLFNLEGMDGA